MVIINAIIDELVTEFKKEFKISKRKILHVIQDAVIEVAKTPEAQKYAPTIIIKCGVAIEKKRFEVVNGDEIPDPDKEALKQLIKKVALRKLKQMEEDQKLRKEKVSKR